MERTNHIGVLSRLVVGHFRDIRKSPVVLIGVTGCLILSTLSMYTLHILAYRIITDSKTQFGMSEYRYLIPLQSRTEDEYFSIRQRWFNEPSRPAYALIPVIEGTIDHEGKVIPLIGLDPIVLLKRQQESSDFGRFSGDPSFLLGTSVIAFGDQLQVGDSVQGSSVSSVFASQNDYILADLATAQEMLQRTHEIDAIWLAASSSHRSEWLDWLLPGLVDDSKPQETDGTLEKYGAQPFTWWNPAEEFNRAIAFQLGILALLALAVATFVIYQITNTAAFRRRREQLRVRTLGVSQIQYATAFLGTYLLVAILACLLGIGLGQLVLEFVLPAGAPDFASTEVLIASSKTFAITSVATVVIVGWAHRLSKNSLGFWSKTIIGLAAVLVTIALLTTDSGLVGAEFAIVLACLANILLLVPLVLFLLGKIVHSRNSERHVSRMHQRSFVKLLNVTRPIVFALAFALANAIGIDVMVSSFRTNFFEMLDARLTEGIYLSNVRKIASEDLQNLDGVSEARHYVAGSGSTDAGVFDYRIASMDEWESSRYGYNGTSPPSLLVNESAAKRMSLKIGDLVDMRLGTGEDLSLRVDHVFRDYGSVAPRFILSDEHFPNLAYPTDIIVLLGDVEVIRQSVRILQRQYPELSVRSDTEIRALAEFVFDQTFFLTRVMATVALIVAVLGLACSLTVYLSMRDTELRLLLTLGISRRELLSANLLHTFGMGTVTVICALPLSILIAWILCEVVHPRAFAWHIDFQVSWWSLLLPSLLCIGAAVIAGFEPMRRALVRALSQPISDLT